MQRRAPSARSRPSGPPNSDLQRSEELDGAPAEASRDAQAALPSKGPARPGTREAVQSALPAVLSWTLVLGLIFGGCCSNVFALEAIVKADPDAGLLFTLAQFLLVAAVTLPKYLSLARPPFFLKEPVIPLWRWVPSIVMFFAVNMLNNFAFSYRISVPVHIILRSGGSVLTMVVGYASGKRYARAQVLGVCLLTVGVVTAAMADAGAKGKPMSVSATTAQSPGTSAIGFLYLFVAALISAIMGLYVQATYAEYGPHWQENLFYSHFLSLPLFLPFFPSLHLQFNKMRASPPWALSLAGFSQSPVGLKLSRLTTDDDLASFLLRRGLLIPEKILLLMLNAVTQYACIRGVNLLAARSSALGVTVVLNIRKLVSLLASIWLFGNELPAGVMIGAAVVFSGASVYATGDNKPKKASADKKEA